MKVKEDVRKISCTQTNLARALNLTQQRVNQLITEGVVVRDEADISGAVLLFRSVQNFFSSKRSSDDEADFWREKALHEKAKRELAELKLAQRRGELYESAVVEQVLVELLTDFKNKLLGVPTKLSPTLFGKSPAQICDLLTLEVEELLKELSTNVKNARYSTEPINEDET